MCCAADGTAVNPTVDSGCMYTVCMSVCSDTAPWLSDLQQVAEMATAQYSELKGVCQHLRQQNESLRGLVKQLVYVKDDGAVCDLGM